MVGYLEVIIFITLRDTFKQCSTLVLKKITKSTKQVISFLKSSVDTFIHKRIDKCLSKRRLLQTRSIINIKPKLSIGDTGYIYATTVLSLAVLEENIQVC